MTKPRAGMLAILLLLTGCSLPQIMIGQYYTIHTAAAGACPRTDWHFVVDAQRRISLGSSPMAGS